MEERKREPLSFLNIALALANDYSRLFVIDPEDDSYAEYSPDGDDKELVKVAEGRNFFDDVRIDALDQVWKDDQEYFISAFRKEAVLSALGDGHSFSLTYRLNIGGEPRYFFLKAIRSRDRSIIIGVRDIDAQKRRELESEDASRTYSEIAESLASLFEVIYYIDTETGSYSEYSASDRYTELGLRHGGEDFFENAKRDIRLIIHPDDMEMVLSRLERDSLISELRRSGTLSMTYRQVLEGRVQYVNLIAFFKQGDTDHIVMGVRNFDKQTREEYKSATYGSIAGALASRYEVIYYINTENNEYTQYSASNEYAKLGTTKQGKDFFADAAEDVRKYIHRHDVDNLLSHLVRDKLLCELERSGSMTFVYRQMLGGEYQYMSMIVVKPKNDEKHIVIGVFNIDQQRRREENMEKQNRTFGDLSMALALQYEVIYYVNIKTNEYYEYSASEKYTRLKIGTVGKDFFAETATNMQHDIFAEDLPMMLESMKKETLLRRLKESGKTFLSYRLILDGRPQFVSLYAVLPKEDSEHIIIAVANVDEAKRMELEYISAVDLANKDALTGVKNKRAYAQAEMELDDCISQGISSEFAVVICDINGLKHVNDTQGHNAGDEFIKSGCSVICEIFDHSPVFRIGGDEFAVIMKGRDFDNRRELLRQFAEIQADNRVSGLVTIACGMSEFDPERDMRVQDVFERADLLMYEDKKRIKAL
ncbi:MAG: GGDEF domain-containing protein [Ruminococcus sp.]|nr:GGDEF domain-containing protein [Ruminococcus sp.]